LWQLTVSLFDSPVALNFQTDGKPMTINRGKFRDNGSCGYVLKPSYLRKPGYKKGDELKRTADSVGWTTASAGPASVQNILLFHNSLLTFSEVCFPANLLP
jgi:hypothetical protein